MEKMHLKYLTPQALTNLMYLDYYFFTQFILTLQIVSPVSKCVCVYIPVYSIYLYIQGSDGLHAGLLLQQKWYVITITPCLNSQPGRDLLIVLLQLMVDHISLLQKFQMLEAQFCK